MKKIITCITLGIIVLLTACSTVDQNINARKNLQKCKFEFEDLKFNKIEFDGLTPDKVDFDLLLKISNPTDDDVVLDKVIADIYLDNKKTTTINHKKLLRIKGKDSAVEKIDLTLKASSILSSAVNRPKNITIDAKIFVNIIIGSLTIDTGISIPVKKTLTIPWDKIDEELAKQTKGASKIIQGTVDKAKDVKNKLKNKFN